MWVPCARTHERLDWCWSIEKRRKRLSFKQECRDFELELSLFPTIIAIRPNDLTQVDRHRPAGETRCAKATLRSELLEALHHISLSLSLMLRIFPVLSFFFFTSFLLRYLYKLSYSLCGIERSSFACKSSITQRPKRHIYTLTFFLYPSGKLCPGRIPSYETNKHLYMCMHLFFNGRDITIAATYPNVHSLYTYFIYKKKKRNIPDESLDWQIKLCCFNILHRILSPNAHFLSLSKRLHSPTCLSWKKMFFKKIEGWGMRIGW